MAANPNAAIATGLRDARPDRRPMDRGGDRDRDQHQGARERQGSRHSAP